MRHRGSLAVGTVLCGKWCILRVLGAGGMATVYEASHRNGKRVAIKALHPDLRSNHQARRRFLREGYIANSVNHPDVPSVLDDGETESRDAFLVMDLLLGDTLDSHWRSRVIAQAEVLSIARAVLDVLSAAHASGIVHRDIKPSNIFLTIDGAVKVLDFGIARMREAVPTLDSSTLSQGGGVPGTPSFMAPEQARGRWDQVDVRTDVWAVGALMFVLLTGRTVHQGQTTNEVLILSATSPAPPVASLRPDLPSALALIVDRALSVHRELRWPDARTMQAAIDALQVDQGELLIEPKSRPHVKRTVELTTSDQLSSAVGVKRKTMRAPIVAVAGSLLVSAAAMAWPATVGNVRSVAAAASASSLYENRISRPPVTQTASVSVPAAELGARSTEAVEQKLGDHDFDAPRNRSRPALNWASSGNRRATIGAAPSATQSTTLSATQPITPSVTSPSASTTVSRDSANDWLERQK